MKKIIFVIMMTCFTSVVIFAAEKKIPNKVTTTTKSPLTPTPTSTPCADSKEDVLKKLEEKKQEEANKGKGFSLQGNNEGGCTLK